MGKAPTVRSASISKARQDMFSFYEEESAGLERKGCGRVGRKGGLVGQWIRDCYTLRPVCFQEGLWAASG